MIDNTVLATVGIVAILGIMVALWSIISKGKNDANYAGGEDLSRKNTTQLPVGKGSPRMPNNVAMAAINGRNNQMIEIDRMFSRITVSDPPTWESSATLQYGPRLADVTIPTENAQGGKMNNQLETMAQKRRRLALAILHMLREFEEENGELKVTYINIERVSGYDGDAGIGGVDVTVEVR